MASTTKDPVLAGNRDQYPTRTAGEAVSGTLKEGLKAAAVVLGIATVFMGLTEAYGHWMNSGKQPATMTITVQLPPGTTITIPPAPALPDRR